MHMSPSAPRAQLLKELERLRQMLNEEMGEAAAEVALNAIPLLEDVVAATPPVDLPGESVFSLDDDFSDEPQPLYPWRAPQPDGFQREVTEWCEDLSELESLLTVSGTSPVQEEHDEIPILSLTDVIAAPLADEEVPAPLEELPVFSGTPVTQAPEPELPSAMPFAMDSVLTREPAEPPTHPASAIEPEPATATPPQDLALLEARISEGAERVLQALMREHLPRLEAELQTRLQDELGELIRLLAQQQAGGH